MLPCFPSTCQPSGARNSQWILAAQPILERRSVVAEQRGTHAWGVPTADAMTDRRDASRLRHAMFELVMARVCAIACGHEDAIDLERLRHDPLMKVGLSAVRRVARRWPRNRRSVVWRMRRARRRPGGSPPLLSIRPARQLGPARARASPVRSVACAGAMKGAKVITIARSS
jgi:hypothetical protein